MSFYDSPVYRKAEWFGLKRYVKGALGLPPVSALARPLARQFLSGDALSRFPTAVSEVTVLALGEPLIMLEPMRCSIAKELFWGNGERHVPRERHALEMFCRLARCSDIALDIGANTGLFTLAAATVSPTVKLHAYEIVPQVFELLVRNICRNNLASRVEAHLYGIGKDGTQLRMPTKFVGNTLPSALGVKTQFDSGADIPLRSLDLVSQHWAEGQRIVGKIDVESAEQDVLENGATMLQRFRPDLICEILPQASSVPVIHHLLARFGYSLYLIEDGGLRKHAHLHADPHCRDWFFTCRDADNLNGIAGMPPRLVGP